MATVAELIAQFRLKAKNRDLARVDTAFDQLRQILLTDAVGRDISQVVVGNLGGLTLDQALTRMANAIKQARGDGAETMGQAEMAKAIEKLLSF